MILGTSGQTIRILGRFSLSNALCCSKNRSMDIPGITTGIPGLRLSETVVTSCIALSPKTMLVFGKIQLEPEDFEVAKSREK